MNDISLENSLKRLESIVAEMESQDISLEKSLELFNEGIQLCQQSKKIIENTEQKINYIKMNNI